MLSILSRAATYFGIYFLSFFVVFWLVLFLSITIQVFWKGFAIMFFVFVGIATFQYFDCANKIKTIVSTWTVPKRPVAA